MMKKLTLGTLLASALLVPTLSYAALIYDAEVTPDVIFGSGNLNGSFTVDQSNGVELGLRGKLRHNASGQPENTYNSNGDGTYSFAAGVAPTQPSPTAVWSFEWSINTDFNNTTGWALGDLTYVMGLDKDSGYGVDFVTFDPINDTCGDHSLGDNTTGNGAGIETNCAAVDAATTYSSNLAAYNVAQNSWKAHWFFTDFDPTVDGIYDISLAAYDGQREVSKTSIQIIVGNPPPAEVPTPAPLALMGLGLMGFVVSRKLKENSAK